METCLLHRAGAAISRRRANRWIDVICLWALRAIIASIMCRRFSVALVMSLFLLSRDADGLVVIGGSVTIVQGGTAVLPCLLRDATETLTQISWQRRTRGKPHTDNFLTILPKEGPMFINGDLRFQYIGNFTEKNGTIQLSGAALKDEGSYSCIFTLFPSGNHRAEIPLTLFVPPVTSVKDNHPTLGTKVVSFATCTAAGSKPPAQVVWVTDTLEEKLNSTTNTIQHENDTATTISTLYGVPTREINGYLVQCVIRSDALHKEETLPFSIQVFFPPTEVNIMQSSEDSFQCVTEANPNASFTWSRPGQSLQQSAIKVEGAKLKLLSMTSDLNGLYQCEASNTYGRNHGHLYVHVTSGACPAAWALFGILLILNIIVGAVWFWKSEHFKSYTETETGRSLTDCCGSRR